MTLGWLAISGRGASTTLDVGSGALAAGGGVAVVDGVFVTVEGDMLSRPKFSWPWREKTPKRRNAPTGIRRNNITKNGKALLGKREMVCDNSEPMATRYE
jgi:hypothetical protein